jgi:hypothetical protein
VLLTEVHKDSEVNSVCRYFQLLLPKILHKTDTQAQSSDQTVILSFVQTGFNQKAIEREELALWLQSQLKPLRPMDLRELEGGQPHPCSSWLTPLFTRRDMPTPFPHRTLDIFIIS